MTASWFLNILLTSFVVLGLTVPEKTGSFEFRHFDEGNTISIKFSKSAPPIAALEDERLPRIVLEPKVTHPKNSKAVKLVAGKKSAWPRLKKYSRTFNRRYPRLLVPHKSTNRITKGPARLIVVKPVKEIRARYVAGMRIIKPQPKRYVPPSKAVTVAQIQKEIDKGSIFDTSLKSYPLIAHYVPNKKPVTKDVKTPRVVLPVPTRTAVRQPKPIVPTPPSPQAPSTPMKTASLLPKASSQDLDPYEIQGQIELTDGLAVTGHLNSLIVRWHSGDEYRDAHVDFNTGEFKVKVPTLGVGTIQAKLMKDKSHILGVGYVDLELIPKPTGLIQTGVPLTLEPLKGFIQGRVVSAYSSKYSTIPVVSAKIMGPVGVQEASDRQGHFAISTVSKESTLLLDAYSGAGWGTRVLASGDEHLSIPVFPNGMIESLLDILGQRSGATAQGIIWGRVTKDGRPLEGVEVSLSTDQAHGPVYFSAHIPNRQSVVTSSDGLFAFVKVQPGLHVIYSRKNGKELPSSVVSVSATKVSFAKIEDTSIRATGHLYNIASNRPVSGRVSIVGVDGETTDFGQGFKLQIPFSDPMMFLDATPHDANLSASRVVVSRKELRNAVPVPIFSKNWIGNIIQSSYVSHSKGRGLIVGYVKGPAFTVHLEGGFDSDIKDQYVHYLGDDLEIEPERVSGMSGGGGFIISNVTPGLHSVVISSIDGELVTTRLVVVEPEIVSAIPLKLHH